MARAHGAGVARALVRGAAPVEAGRVLELDWQVPDEDESVVRFELSPDGDGTKLVLDHRRIEARLGMAYMQRWRLPLERLA